MLSVALCLALVSAISQAQTTPADRTAPPAGVNVSGRLITDDGASLASGTVTMSPARSRSDRQFPGHATVRPDGSFIFHEVPEGDYILRARARTSRGTGSLFGAFAVPVRSRDVTGVDLTLKPGAVVRGEVVVDRRHASAPPALDRLRVRAPLPDGSSFGDPGGANVARDGTFTLDSVMAGSHVLIVQGLVFPWRIAEARILGRDAVERAFDVDAGQEIGGVRIVLSDLGAGIAGTVAAPAGVPLADVLVVAFPEDPLRRALPLRFVRVARPAATGEYRIVDLAADRYRVIAAAHATEQDALDPGVLERWLPASTPVKLAETQIADVPLTAIAPATPTRVP